MTNSASPPLARGDAEFVMGQRAMAEADGLVAKADQGIGRGLRLLEPFGRARQFGVVDQPLMTLEPRHMGVAEQSQPLRLERDRELGAVRGVLGGLVRQAIHCLLYTSPSPR